MKNWVKSATMTPDEMARVMAKHATAKRGELGQVLKDAALAWAAGVVPDESGTYMSHDTKRTLINRWPQDYPKRRDLLNKVMQPLIAKQMPVNDLIDATWDELHRVSKTFPDFVKQQVPDSSSTETSEPDPEHCIEDEDCGKGQHAEHCPYQRAE